MKYLLFLIKYKYSKLKRLILKKGNKDRFTY